MYEAFCTFLLGTAARRSEAMRFAWCDARLSEAAGWIPLAKNGRPRAVPLRQDVIALIERLPRTHERVFPITIDELKNAWSRICRRAQITDFPLHCLRHEGISQIAQNGHLADKPFTLLDLAQISGHLDLRTLMRYAHLCVGTLARRLDGIFQRVQDLKYKDPSIVRKGRVPIMSVLGPARDGPAGENLGSTSQALAVASSTVAPLNPRSATILPFKPRGYSGCA